MPSTFFNKFFCFTFGSGQTKEYVRNRAAPDAFLVDGAYGGQTIDTTSSIGVRSVRG